MSIERIKGNVAFFCDRNSCTESIDTETRDFAEAKDMAKEEGWVFAKRGENWKHFCSAKCERDNFRLSREG